MNINKEKLFDILTKKLNRKWSKKELMALYLEDMFSNDRPRLFHFINETEFKLITKD